MNKSREQEVYINPSLRRSRALRSMLPVLLSRRAETGNIRSFHGEPDKKTR
ncbi:MAG: hypothetical protein AB1384_08600 [Actinomycetota bacterium]